MALGSLPPWLSVSPSDFVRATQAGAQLGHTIADSTLRAFEEQQRMKMAADQHEAQLSQQAIENAAVRLAADRLENYRQQEVANRKEEFGIEQQRADSYQQRADDLARHQLVMEQAKANVARPEAGITTLPEAPGFTFLKNPSGALTPLMRPPHPQSPLERARLQMSGINAMAPRGAEDPTSLDYQARTNAIGGILRSLNPSSLPSSPYKEGSLLKNKKDGKMYRVQNGVPVIADQQDPEDAD